ncbi:MAG TPA: SDR family oxidoreductase [Acidiphilium sp.]|nr:SDR family oxidoreductase [Acidiphilium sp.]
MANRILVTGGAGYLGSTMVPDLLADGHKVLVLDNFRFKQASLNNCYHYQNFSVVKGDIRVEATVAPLLKEADIVFPLAALVSRRSNYDSLIEGVGHSDARRAVGTTRSWIGSTRHNQCDGTLVGAPLCNVDPIGATTTNHDAIALMLRLLSRDQMIPMPMANSAYGTGDENNLCTKESQLRPISRHAVEKVAIERELMQHSNAICLRLATVFGMSPRIRLDLLVTDLTYRAVHDRFIVLFERYFKRYYIHVRDVSRAFRHALSQFDLMKREIYDVGLSNANVSIAQLYDHIQRQCPDFVFIDAPVGKDPDQRSYVVSNVKIEATGLTPKLCLDWRIGELIKGYTMIKNSVYSNV